MTTCRPLPDPTDATPKGPLWDDALHDWTATLLDAGRTPATVDGYALHVGWLARDLGHLVPDPWDMTTPLLTGWLDAHTWAVTTRRKVLNSLRGFYSHAVALGVCQRSPLAGIAAAPPRTSGPQRLRIAPAWADAAEHWTTWLRASSTAPGTIRTRLHWLRLMSETFADPWAVTSADLAALLARDDWLPETKRSCRATARTFYAWAVTAGHLDTSPATDLATIRIPRTVPRPAPDYALVDAFRAADERTRLALALACYAGLRRAEIAAVHTTDIGPDLLRVRGKGGHERMVPVHPTLAHFLDVEMRRRRDGIRSPGWPRLAPPGGWLFPSLDPAQHLIPFTIGKLLDRVLPDGWTPHTLRHRFATQAYAAERDLRAVQELLGHASPATTIRYAAVPDGALTAAVHAVSTPINASAQRG